MGSKKMNEDQQWQKLLELAAPAYAGEAQPPFGFTTRVLAQIRAEQRQCEMMERVGLRAIFASLGVLALAGLLLVGANHYRNDMEPGLRNVLQVENIAVS
jgi:hypothetical protein